MANPGLRESFEGFEVLRDLTEPELMDIVRTLTIKTVEAKEIIYDVGQVPDGMYLIQGGAVRLVQCLPDGSTEILSNLLTHQSFGEEALIRAAPSDARAVAVTSSSLYVVDRARFNTLRANFHPSAFRFLRAVATRMARRLRETKQKVVLLYENPDQSLDYLQQRASRIRTEERAWR